MRKKIASVILAAFLILPSASWLGVRLAIPFDPFREYDEAREAALLSASGAYSGRQGGSLDGESETVYGRYILRFSASVEKADIADILGGYDYSLLSHSDDRLFAVCLPDYDEFCGKYGDMLLYIEEDGVLGTLAVTDDPVGISAFASSGINEAWDLTFGSESVIVAVLDTGVFRDHEELANAHILAGYDAVEGVSPVSSDTSGHGTAVIGIIAAQANNGLGSSGASPGVSVLPVRVASSCTTIYSSDLVAGIRFAADAGADIINMSVGGYSSSYAEQDAVDYAVSLGCILISASGNEGNRVYAGKKSYPASYDGVISVGSVDENGKHSDFSQYNDCVDVCAPGEDLPILLIGEDGSSGYGSDSGTSYSCAIVSGIAALALSYISPGARLGGEEFLSLIISTCGTERDDYLGYGVINAAKILERCDYPIVTGISDGAVYTDKVRVGFNRGYATLDGEEMDDGETVIISGQHTVIVTDGERMTRVSFRLDYDPLSYEYKEYTGFAMFTFGRGEATLDGYPYTSASRITASGEHIFALTYGSETLTKRIDLHYDVPAVYGIEDGKSYSSAVNIVVIGDGSVLLDGVETEKDITVSANGSHRLVVRSGSGGRSKTYSFAVNDKNLVFSGRTDYANGKGIIDGENGYMMLYGETLVGARVYDLDNPTEFTSVLRVGRINGYAFAEEGLLLFCDDHVSVIDRKKALSDTDNCVIRTIGPTGATAFAFGNGTLYCFTQTGVYTADISTGVLTLVRSLGFACEKAFVGDNKVCMLSSSDRRIRLLDIETLSIKTVDPGFYNDGAGVCFGEGYIALGNRLISLSDGRLALEFESEGALIIGRDIIITENYAIDIATGRITGSFPFEVSDICETSDRYYIFGKLGEMLIYSKNGLASPFGAAEKILRFFSDPTKYGEYRLDAYASGSIVSAEASGDLMFFITESSNSLVLLDSSLGSEKAFPLLYQPSGVFASNGYVCVVFGDEPFIYLAPESDVGSGRYITIASSCDKALYIESTVFFIAGGYLGSYDLSSERSFLTSISVWDIAVSDNRIFTCGSGRLTVYGTGLTRITSVAAEGGTCIYSGEHIAVGSNIYDSETLLKKCALNEKVIALSGFVAVTENGVYDIRDSIRVGFSGITSPSGCVVTTDNRMASFGSGRICSNGFFDGRSLLALSETNLESDGSVFTGEAKPVYSSGTGYLDGVLFPSGGTVSESGVHWLIIVFPCGRGEIYEFTVASRVSGIEIVGGDCSMSVGESIMLQINYLPDGSGSVPVTFRSGGTGITVKENGEVTATKTGIYSVIASADTDYGRFTALCRITVRDDLIRFREESGIYTDRRSGMILGVPAGTTAASLIGELVSGSGAKLLSPDGESNVLLAGTGSVLVLYDGSGAECDRMTVVVRGDIDGDGYINASDLYHIERVLKGYNYGKCYVAAADTNSSGGLDNGDFYTLRRMMTGKITASLGTPEQNEFGSAEIQTQTLTIRDGIIDVVICLRGCKTAFGVTGKLTCGSGLELVSCIENDWEADYGNTGSEISFYAYDENAAQSGRAFKILLCFRFRVTGEEGSNIDLALSALSVSFADGARTVVGGERRLTVTERATGEFSMGISNADSFLFDEGTGEYDIVIPFDAALADISFIFPEGGSVVSDTAMIPEGGGSIHIKAVSADGKGKYYTVRVKRQNAEVYDTDCRLSSLEIEGCRLSPAFDPDIFEYSITVPDYVTEIKPYCAAKSKNAKISIGSTLLDQEHTVIRITVFSPEGDKLIYKLNVYRSSSGSSDEGTSEQEPAGTPDAPLIIACVFCGAALLAAIIVLALRRKKNKE